MIRFIRFLPKSLRRLGVAAALGSLMGGACHAEGAAGRQEAAGRDSRLAMRAPLSKETAARPPASALHAAQTAHEAAEAAALGALEADRLRQAEAARKGVLALLVALAQGGPESALWAESGRGLRPRRTSRAADGRDPAARSPSRRRRPLRGGKA
ncbi:hypothetical protein [Neomegalonema perideroedes]|uniref:hypothetical protein n=1 Tax=Neomegalonema perideroedes TaxID=217219 RepID=UPI00047692F8|nr:hypothetical protein [Neomegalonema perideroedes]